MSIRTALPPVSVPLSEPELTEAETLSVPVSALSVPVSAFSVPVPSEAEDEEPAVLPSEEAS